MKTTFFPMSLLAAALALSGTAQAAEKPVREVRINTERLNALAPTDQVRVLEIKDRLDAIIAVDRSSLDASERAELRSEWKELKSEMKEYNRNGSVIYISTAGLIIIILLLILIF